MTSKILLIGLLAGLGAWIIISLLAPYVAIVAGVIAMIKLGPLLVGQNKPRNTEITNVRSNSR